MIKNNIHIIIWWCCQSVHCKEKTSYDHGVQNVPEHSSKNLHLLLHKNKVEFLQGRFRNKSIPCPQKEKWGFFRTFLFYLCVLTESLSPWNAEFWSWKPLHRECRAAILLTLSQHMSHHEILQCSPHNMVGPGRGTRGGEASCGDVKKGCMGD